MPENTYGSLNPEQAGLSAAHLLERGQEIMVFERYGQKDSHPKHSTLLRRYRRYNHLAAATSPLTEGVTPAGQKLTFEDIAVTLKQYGDWVPLTDVMDLALEDPIYKETLDICAQQLAETVELLRFYTLRAGTNVYYANGVTARTSVTSKATRGDFRLVVRGFKRNRARVITQIIKASAKIDTSPVAPAFWAVCHPDCEPDIVGLTGFTPVEQYADSDKRVVGEFGKLENIRFVSTSLAEPWLAAGASGTTYLSNGAAVSSSAACDVYPILIFAQNAYAIVPLQGEGAVVPMAKKPEAIWGDQLAQKGFVSWKTWQATVILNQAWMARLEVAATANPS